MRFGPISTSAIFSSSANSTSVMLIFTCNFKPPGPHTTAPEPKRGHWRVGAFKNTTKIQREDPQEKEERMKIVAGVGKTEGGPAEGGHTVRGEDVQNLGQVPKKLGFGPNWFGLAGQTRLWQKIVGQKLATATSTKTEGVRNPERRTYCFSQTTWWRCRSHHG